MAEKMKLRALPWTLGMLGVLGLPWGSPPTQKARGT